MALTPKSPGQGTQPTVLRARAKTTSDMPCKVWLPPPTTDQFIGILMNQNAEQQRLHEGKAGHQDWKRWGPYLSERQWGTVREDYSPHGNAWEHFRTITPEVGPIAGVRTASPASVTTSNDSASRSCYGTARIPFLRNASSVSPIPKAITART